MASCRKNTCAANRQSQDRYFVWECRRTFRCQSNITRHKRSATIGARHYQSPGLFSINSGVCVCACVRACVCDLGFLSGTSGLFGEGGGGGVCGACVLHTNSNIAIIEHYCIMCICIPISLSDGASPTIPPYPAH